MRKWSYLSSWATNHKTKDTLLSQTLKVEEKKVSLFFWFVAQEPRYGHFIFWRSGSEVRSIFKGSKGQYLGPWATNKKTKDTLLSQTFFSSLTFILVYKYIEEINAPVFRHSFAVYLLNWYSLTDTFYLMFTCM